MTEPANAGEITGAWLPPGIVQSWTAAPDSHPDHSATDVSAGSAPFARSRSTSTFVLSGDGVSLHPSYVAQVSAVVSAPG